MLKIERPVLAFAAIAALLVAPWSGAATEIQLWHAMDGAPGEVLERLVSRYNASQADVKVLADYKGDYPGTLRAGLAAAQAGSPPHILQVYEVGAADMLAAPRLFKPVHQVALEWGSRFDREEYFAPAAAYYSDAGGRLQALPFNSSTPVLFVNRDLFAKAGLDPDKPPKTWPEMQLVLLDLQKAGVDCPYTSASQSWIHLENMSAWHNQAVASHNNGLSGDRPELRFNNRLMIRHISLLAAWARSELFRYPGRRGDPDNHFVNGECALLTASSAAYSDIVRAGRFKLGVAPLPHYDDYPGAPFNTLIGGAALWVMAGKPPREYKGVAHFLAWLATPAVAAEWHETTGYIPMSRAAYLASKRSGFYERHPEQEISVAQMRGAHSGNFARGVRLRHFAEIRAIVDEELNAVWNSGRAPIDALEKAVERGNALLRPARVASPAPAPARNPMPSPTKR
ncbi:MAG: sn-glycerol-3-phosphate ABC transporter substrate-binding protein UgpB [Betaproteobacteria bacterium]|nr:sn-glycerol-3-phosphate ABC transporter substrate-binding protein UgpB [Betaproteobacteria bacterium]